MNNVRMSGKEHVEALRAAKRHEAGVAAKLISSRSDQPGCIIHRFFTDAPPHLEPRIMNGLREYFDENRPVGVKVEIELLSSHMKNSWDAGNCLACGWAVVGGIAQYPQEGDVAWYCANTLCEHHAPPEFTADQEVPEWVA